MSKLATTLKEEITRLGRREAKAAAVPLKRRIAALERLVREQRAALKQFVRQAAARKRSPGPTGSARGASETSADGARLSPRLIRSQRKRLHLTQAEFGLLAGVTPVAVWLWESGRSKPREATRAALLRLRALGVREARRRVEEMEASKPRRKAAGAIAKRKAGNASRGAVKRGKGSASRTAPARGSRRRRAGANSRRRRA